MNQQQFSAMCNKAFQATLDQKGISVNHYVSHNASAYYDNDSGERCIVGHMLTIDQCTSADRRLMDVHEVCNKGMLGNIDAMQRDYLCYLQDAYDEQLYGGTREGYIERVKEILSEFDS